MQIRDLGMLAKFWETVVLPLLWRPTRFQVAALCYRKKAGQLEVLLITSRDTGRWILPKGWPKRGLDASGVAVEEAWEEAGVKGRKRRPERIGHYRYAKRLKGGVPVKTDVDVFAIEVEKLLDTFPEMSERRRKWVSPAEAAEAVEEPELKELLNSLTPEQLG
jgi:8-oxo-dGTP pyrophosphatase MutT (NUDIX family)